MTSGSRSDGLHIWNDIPVGATCAYETQIGSRVAIRSWARREDDPSPGLRRIAVWQEVDFAAFNRPGGLARAVTRIDAKPNLAPRRIAILSVAGEAVFRFSAGKIAVRFVDGTRLETSSEPLDFALLDNSPALVAIYARVLDATNRLPGTFRAYLPGTLATIPYSLERDGNVLRSSLGEVLRFDNTGWLSSLTVGDSIDIRRVDGTVPRWRSLAPSHRAQTTDARTEESKAEAQDLVIQRDGHRLHGRLVGPHDPRALLLLIGGSGLHDRFGHSGVVDLGYGDLAAQLASRGIGTLLFDKPGAGRTKLTADVARPSFAAAVAIAQSWLDELVRRAPLGVPVIVAGHSQGGQIAAYLAAHSSEVAGLCLLATAYRPIDSILAEQINIQAQDLSLSESARQQQLSELKALFDWLRSGDRSGPPPSNLAPLAHLSEWYGGLIDTHPATTLPHVRIPVAILHGDRDIQVPSREASALATLLPYDLASVKIFEGLDHLFKRSGEASNIRHYGDRRRKMSRDVPNWIAGWIERAVLLRSNDER
ncbi:alpha/beta hydrolase [Sinorhizobium psoraleae]|uniref:Alpha/beta fold hydrolase n=1 Tax=Sinorhizobium psoraleae TaxID=520838 RepID=A0ABT4KNV8_9HYPH|nr:alpha/beta fold hydrolase [Sinorhizobium psoraleae]MCZ4093465.1 alpha/beta fold hydrolase [Sinorhizobium psoraleae]